MPLRPTTHGWRDASTRLSKCETSHAALANTQIGVSPPHAPHITGRWNTQWDLTYNALPPGYALAASALSKQIPPLSAISPAMLCHPDTCWPLPQFPNRSHSSHRPSFAITTSTPPLHGHQSAYSTSTRTPITLSSRIHAPHITGRWNTQWDLTCNALPRERTSPPSALQMQTLFSLSWRRVVLPPLNRPTLSCCFYPTQWTSVDGQDSSASLRSMCVLPPHWSAQKRVSGANASRSAGTVAVST